MKYMLLIYSAESCWTDDERRACMIESLGICDQLAAVGNYITSAPLQYVPTAATVRVRDGKSLVTAGPFAETTEQLGGYYILELENLDEAIAVASRLPPAKKGTVEIRPIFSLDGLPAEKLDLVHDHDPALTPYMFLCYDDEGFWTKAGPEVHREAMMEAVAVTHELAARGHFISAAPLHPVATATSVRVRNGQRIITDGPFAETREVLGGYYLILAKNQKEALNIAARHSGARVGAVEVRPLFDVSSLRKNPESFPGDVETPVGQSTT
jgi:hypothetical protein